MPRSGAIRSRMVLTASMWPPAWRPTVVQTPTQIAAPTALATRNRAPRHGRHAGDQSVGTAQERDEATDDDRRAAMASVEPFDPVEHVVGHPEPTSQTDGERAAAVPPDGEGCALPEHGCHPGHDHHGEQGQVARHRVDRGDDEGRLGRASGSRGSRGRPATRRRRSRSRRCTGRRCRRRRAGRSWAGPPEPWSSVAGRRPGPSGRGEPRRTSVALSTILWQQNCQKVASSPLVRCLRTPYAHAHDQARGRTHRPARTQQRRRARHRPRDVRGGKLLTLRRGRRGSFRCLAPVGLPLLRGHGGAAPPCDRASDRARR